MYTMSSEVAETVSGRRSAPARPGARLSRPVVLAAAVRLADSEGVDAVSMRRLSTELGVVPMALYKHVADKDDLLAGMVDVVVAGYREPDPGLDWREAVRQRIMAARDALHAHPWLRSTIERASQRTPAVLAYMDSLAGEFRRGGLSYDLVHHAMHALGHRIWGFSPEAFAAPDAAAGAAPGGSAPPAPDPAELAALAARFPHVVAIAVDTAQRNPQGACDTDAEFDFTLDLLLDAFGRLHESGWVSR